MIRVALISKHYQQIEPLIQNILDQNDIEFRLSNYRHQTVQDIYFIEIERKEDLKGRMNDLSIDFVSHFRRARKV